MFKKKVSLIRKTPANTQENQQKRGSSVYQHSFLLWFTRHLYACLLSLGRLSRAPFATLMTVAVIGISLSLPVGLYIFLSNAEKISANWSDSTQISLFLSLAATEADREELIRRLQGIPEIASIDYISPEEGLLSLQKQAGLSDIISTMPVNPLPGVIQATPDVSLQTPAELEALVVRLGKLPSVDVTQLDMQWVQRFYGILHVAEQVVFAVLLLLGSGVVLVVWNTIRLATQNYREELEIIKLIGATDAFVRRPFLYTGFFYGLFGGTLGCIFVDAILIGIRKSVDQLVHLYNSQFQMQELGFDTVLCSIIGLGAALGWIGSYLAVHRQLRDLTVEK